MNKSDELLGLYFGCLMPSSELTDSIKTKIDQQIIKSGSDAEFFIHTASENIFDTPIYRRTAEIFRKAFSVSEKYKIIFGEE